MLTDSELKRLKGRAKPCKVADRDGMYAHVSPAGTVSFLYDHRMVLSDELEPVYEW